MISHVNRFFGYSVHFKNGLHLGFNWVHGNGETSKTSAVLAGYSPPWSLTWGWALYWEKPLRLFSIPRFIRWKPSPKSEHSSTTIVLPVGGSITLRTQGLMRIKGV